MAQAPGQSAIVNQPPAVSGFYNRAMTPVRNPIYVYNDDDSFKTAHPYGRNVLDRPPVDTERGRLTSQGSMPPVTGLTPIVAMAGQTPHNVWALYPA